MTDKDVILNNLHYTLGDAEREMSNRLLKDRYYIGEVSKELELQEEHVMIKVTVELWALEEKM